MLPASRLSPEQLVYDFYQSQNPMLIQNWKRVVTLPNEKMSNPLRNPFLSCMKVSNQVATVCNYDVMIRVSAPGIPNGYYSITDSEMPSRLGTHWWVKYPDVDSAMITGEEVQAGRPPFMDNNTLGELLAFVSSLKTSGPSIYLSNDAAFVGNSAIGDKDVTKFNFPFNIPHMFRFCMDSLEIALRECLRYPHVCFYMRASNDLSSNVPALFIGGWTGSISWDNCVMVMPLYHGA